MALVVENLPANAGDIRDPGSVPGLGRSPEGGHGNPLHYCYLENPMDRGTWWATVHRVAKSWTRLKLLSMHASEQAGLASRGCSERPALRKALCLAEGHHHLEILNTFCTRDPSGLHEHHWDSPLASPPRKLFPKAGLCDPQTKDILEDSSRSSRSSRDGLQVHKSSSRLPRGVVLCFPASFLSPTAPTPLCNPAQAPHLQATPPVLWLPQNREMLNTLVDWGKQTELSSQDRAQGTEHSRRSISAADSRTEQAGAPHYMAMPALNQGITQIGPSFSPLPTWWGRVTLGQQSWFTGFLCVELEDLLPPHTWVPIPKCPARRSVKNPRHWSFPSVQPVAKTPRSQCRGPGFNPWSGK